VIRGAVWYRASTSCGMLLKCPQRQMHPGKAPNLLALSVKGIMAACVLSRPR